ncbi:hypothetical protein HKCCE3408_15130 [Rhodobacterales bacterium HKCCE3408]|nr:hypothetical protein [Rhodobacterales bacterium HKCCE3408]
MARKSRLMGILAILLVVSGNPEAQAAYTRQDLEMLQMYIETEQWLNLNEYLSLHPELLEGNSLLAQELREYERTCNGSGGGFIGCVLPQIATIQNLQSIY